MSSVALTPSARPEPPRATAARLRLPAAPVGRLRGSPVGVVGLRLLGRRPRPARRCGCGSGCGPGCAGRPRGSPREPSREPPSREPPREPPRSSRGLRSTGGGVDDPALGARRDALVVEEVLGGRVGLLRLLERQVQRLVDHLPAVQVGPVDEGDRDAGRAGPAGAADPVDVGLVVLGAGVVDDVRDAGDVDAAGGDVGGDQDAELALAELGQRLLAGHLRHVAVQRAGR